MIAMKASDIELCMVFILIVSIRMQAYTTSMIVAALTAWLMGTHQMYKFLKQEKTHDDSRE